jgi:urease accessory protein
MKQKTLQFSSGREWAGHAILEVGVVYRESTVTSACSTSPMKLLTPRARGSSVWAYTSSFGGGLVAGDQTRLDVSIGAGARCFIGTQASTKVYRNPGQLPSGHATYATVEEDALLVFAPDPIQAYSGSFYTQQQEFHLTAGASLVLLDWFSSGRNARGERWEFAQFSSRNDIFVDGHRVFVDSIFLDSLQNSPSAQHQCGRYNCFATLLMLGPAVQTAVRGMLEANSARPIDSQTEPLNTASPLEGGAVLRVAGETAEAVQLELLRHLRPLAGLLGDDPWSRKS